MEVPQKMKIELPYDTAIPLLDIYPKEKINSVSDICTPVFTAAVFTIAKIWNQHRCPIIDEWKRKCGIYTQWRTIQPEKQSNPVICGDMDETGGHYVKWHKLGTSTLHVPTRM